MKPLIYGSLFAGIGGIDLGFDRAGMRCGWQVENNSYAKRVLEKHWPGVRRWDDVRTFPPEPVDEWRVDVIAGGFPCQDISRAGRGAGITGEQSGLFAELLRTVRTLRPRIVVLENVAALLFRGLGDVLGNLAALGYDTEHHCLPAAHFGAPHIRDRVFVMAHTDGAGLPIPELETIFRAGREGKGRTAPQCSWWRTEPDVGRVANGVPNRVDRLRCLGNAVVPQVAEYVGRQIVAKWSTDQ